MTDAVPDGVRLAELIDQLPLSRGSVFEVVKALGVRTAKGPGVDGKGRVAWLSAADADRVAEAAHRVHNGQAKIAELATGLATQQTRQTLPAPLSAPSADSPDPAPFLARMEAAEKAIRSGLGLSTMEAAWILGVRPHGEVFRRGGIVATRTGWNCWWLRSAESGDAAGR